MCWTSECESVTEAPRDDSTGPLAATPDPSVFLVETRQIPQNAIDFAGLIQVANDLTGLAYGRRNRGELMDWPRAGPDVGNFT